MERGEEQRGIEEGGKGRGGRSGNGRRERKGMEEGKLEGREYWTVEKRELGVRGDNNRDMARKERRRSLKQR